jgi:hypothetical protein
MNLDSQVASTIQSGDVLLDSYGYPAREAVTTLAKRIRKATGNRFISETDVYTSLKCLKSAGALRLAADGRTAL